MALERLRKLRQDKNLTQAEIANILYVNQSTYSGYETGSRTIPYHLLAVLADYYHTSVDYLIGRVDK